jgi:FKBP-type peptidyl-prolyl cis-trans isomerase
MLKKTLLSFLFGMIICAIACSPNATAEKEEPQISPEVEDELVSRLAASLIADPANNQEIENNSIINYAIDNLLDVVTTPSGLHYQIIKEGTGEKANWGDYVTVNYRGRLMNGKTFDSAEAYQFYIGNMIKGWNEGLELLAQGGKAIFLIPSHLAYADKGLGQIIPPNSVLVFDIELLAIKKK